MLSPRYELYAAFVGRDTVLFTIVGSAGFAAYALFVLYAVYVRHGCLCLTSFWLLLLIVLALVLATLFLAYWVWTSDDIPIDSINAIRGTEISRHAQSFDDFLTRELQVALSLVEGAVCSTYTMCCRDPKLEAPPLSISAVADSASSNNATCIARREGQMIDIETALEDPSSPNFCTYATGATVLVSPPRGVCLLIDSAIGDFSLAACQANFCAAGIDAYLAFVNQMVALLQRFAVPLGVAMGLLVFFLIIWACNVRYVGKRLRRKELPTTTATFTTNADGTARPNYAEPRTKKALYNV